MAGSTYIFDEWGDGSTYADEVHVTEHKTHSMLLGPDGRRLAYRQPDPVGFRLVRKTISYGTKTPTKRKPKPKK